MKTILLLGMLSVGHLTTGLATAAITRLTDDTPAAVKAAMAKLYPTVKKVKYAKENSDFEAEFAYKGNEMSAVFDAKGMLKETETEIAVSALPASVRDYVAKQMPGKKIKEAAEIVDAKGVKTYEAEVGGKDLMFDMAGKPLK